MGPGGGSHRRYGNHQVVRFRRRPYYQAGRHAITANATRVPSISPELLKAIPWCTLSLPRLPKEVRRTLTHDP